jgi:hypothetical protein
MQDIVNGELAADVNDMVGPCGTPDNGFQIGFESAGSPPTLWSPPSGSQDGNVNSQYDFLIGPGTMYIGGQRAVFPACSPGQPGPYYYSYFDQPDWLNPESPGSPSSEVVYLRLFEQEVSAVEDPDLLDVALGGPDTTQRVRLMRRVERCPGSACGDAATYWSQQGFTLDPNNNRLLPQVLLQASYTAPPSATDPCDPVATGGYLGAYNQLIRIELRNSDPGSGPPLLLWGYDNASFLYRVSVGADGQKLTLAKAPVDTFHWPVQNQVVEILPAAAVLASDQNQANPAQPILRCVAEAKGFLTTLQGAYTPAADGSGGTVVLTDKLSSDYINSETPVFLRIWQGWQLIKPGSSLLGQGFTLVDNATQASTGLTITLSATPDATGTLPDGAFWMIAVRPSTPQAVYPERFLDNPQRPDGPRQWMCPLAVIDWTGGSSSPPGGSPPGPVIAHECRNEFDNLVTLTERKLQGCCTVRVVPDDAQAPGGLQAIIDKAVGGTSAVTVCFGPGVYQLPEPLRLDSSHSNLTLEACQPGAVLQAAQGAETGFLDGLVVLTQANNVTLQGLTFNLPIVPFVKAGGTLVGLGVDQLRSALGVPLNNLYCSVGVRPLDCNGLTIQECTFTYPDFSALGSSQIVDGFAAGILSSGGCIGLTIEANSFNGKIPSSANIGSEPFQFQIGYMQTPVSTASKTSAMNLNPTEFPPGTLGVSGQLARVRTKVAPGGTGPTGPSLEMTKASGATSKKAGKKSAAAALAAAAVSVAPVTASARRGFIRPFQRAFDPSIPGYYIFNGTLLPSWLQDAVFRDNFFSGLTLAVFALGEMGSLRVEDNEIENSYSGLWFFPKRSFPSPTPDQTNNLEPELVDVIQDPVVLVASAIARGYPLPQKFPGPSESVTVTYVFAVPSSPGVTDSYGILQGLETSVEAQAALSTAPGIFQGYTFSLICSNNRIDAELSAKDLSSPGSALIVWADENAQSSEIILSNNNLTNASGATAVPTAVLVSLTSCIVTGNLISNFPTVSMTESLIFSYSLIGRIPNAAFFDVSVTGNVFWGQAVVSAGATVFLNTAAVGNVFHGGFFTPASGVGQPPNVAITGNVFQGGPTPPQPWAGMNAPLPLPP